MTDLLLHGQYISHALAGVVHVGFHVDDGDDRPLGKALEDLLPRAVGQVDCLAEAADGDSMAHAAQHTGYIGHALCSILLYLIVESRSVDLTRGEEVGVSAQLSHACFEAVPRAQRHTIEDHEERHVLQQSVRLADGKLPLQIMSHLENRLDLFPVEIPYAEEISAFERVCLHQLTSLP